MVIKIFENRALPAARRGEFIRYRGSIRFRRRAGKAVLILYPIIASYLLYKSISNKEGNLLWITIFVSGLILGGINVLFFTKSLKEIKLSIAYPVFSGACIFFMVVLPHIIFDEKISAVNMVGAVAVAIGIALMSN